MRCQICRGHTAPSLDLRHQPVSDVILSAAELVSPRPFNEDTASHIPSEHGPADAMTVCGVFSHVPIVDAAWMFEDRPDAGTPFAWNYHDEIVPKLRGDGFEGEALLP